MKVSPELVGRVVSVQVARPLYMIDYAAHMAYADGRKLLSGEPLMTENANGKGPVAMDILLGAEVVAVAEDNITVAILMPSQSIVHHMIPSALIVDIAEVKVFESEVLPTITTRKRATVVDDNKRIIL
jgi:hypothetical protein